MSTIQVTLYPVLIDLISVNVEGFCNHAGTSFEDEEFDEPNPYGQDQVSNDVIEVCNKCNAWRNMHNADWQGVQQLPIIRGDQ